MKTSFLKNFFNSKDQSIKNVNIHSIDLDESDDILVDTENNGIFGSKSDKFMKSNIFSHNESLSSNTSLEIKSPFPRKTFDFGKFRKSPMKSPFHSKIDQMKCATPKLSNLERPNDHEENERKFNSPNLRKFSPNISSPIAFDNSKIRNIRNTPKSYENQNVTPKKNNSISLKKFTNFKSSYETNNETREKSNLKSLSNNNLNDSLQDTEISTKVSKNPSELEMHSDETENKEDHFTFEFGDKSIVNNNDKTLDQNDCDDTKLKALHIKLKMEAERINKWKEDVENEINMKTRKLLDSERIIESLRTSNLELQMHQESISLSFKEEIESRSNVLTKVDNSRQLCQILKRKIEDLECKQQNYNTEKNRIECLQNHITILLNSMICNTKNIIDVQFKFQNKLKLKDFELLEMKENNVKERNEFEHKITSLELEKNNIELILNELTEKNNELSLHITTITNDKNEINNLYEKEKNENGDLKEKEILLSESLSKKEKEIENNVVEIDKLNADIGDLKLKILKYEEDKEELLSNNIKERDNYQKIIENYQYSETQLKLDADVLKEKNFEKEKLIDEQKISFESLEKEFNDKINLKDVSIDKLTDNILEKENEISQLTSKILEIENETTKLHDQLNQLKKETEMTNKNSDLLKLNNNDLREELMSKNKSLEELTTKWEKLNANEKINEQYITNLEDKLKEQECITGQLEETKLKLQKENDQYKDRIQQLEIHVNDWKSELETVKSTSADTIADKEDNNLKLKNEITLLQTELRKISGEVIDKNEYLIDERNKSEKQVSINAELQNEIETLKGQLNVKLSEINEYSNKNLKLQSELTAQLNIVSELEEKIKKNENSSKENLHKIVSLEDFVKELSLEKQNILKSREELRKELMLTLEQCKNDHELTEKKKDKEIENLKKIVESQKCDKQNSKKWKNNLADVTAELEASKKEINKLDNVVQLLTNEKNKFIEELKEMKKSSSELITRSQDIETKNTTLENSNIELQNKLLQNLTEISVLKQSLESKDEELIKLKALELEENRNLQSESPPCTQIPEYIKLLGTTTPKSQKLSVKLMDMSTKNKNNKTPQKTPQKTPKGILRQPGSASKRRRVNFEEKKHEETFNVSEDESLISDIIDLDLENINPKNKVSNTNIVFTPKPQKLSIKGIADSKTGKLTNVRKTPSKTPKKICENKMANENWFDNDNFFGACIEA